jgi:capsular polysaccharide transport system permease protein
LNRVERLEDQSAAVRPRRRLRLPFLFIFVVVAPNLLAIYYFLAVASPIYVSEARFVLRTPSQPSISAVPRLGAMLQGVGLKPADTDAFAVHAYILSRNAVAELDKGRALRRVLGPSDADPIARFPRPFEKPSAENLYRAYKRFIGVDYDSTTGISTLTVKAFNPADARQIANALLDQGEVIVNRLNIQAQTDAVDQARRDLQDAQGRLVDAQARMTAYRNRNKIVDPQSAGQVATQLIGKLASDLATLRAERNGIAASTPQSPELPGLDQRIRAYDQQLASESAKIAGENDSLASKIGEYERLSLEAAFLERAMGSAATRLEGAAAEARNKQLYLQRVVEPTTADSPALPLRWRNILTVMITSLLAYGALVLIVAGVREHRQ